jgi:hypothetical protein
MIRQAFRIESMSHTWMFEWKGPLSLREKMRQVKSNIKSMLIIFFDMKGIEEC